MGLVFLHRCGFGNFVFIAWISNLFAHSAFTAYKWLKRQKHVEHRNSIRLNGMAKQLSLHIVRRMQQRFPSHWWHCWLCCFFTILTNLVCRVLWSAIFANIWIYFNSNGFEHTEEENQYKKKMNEMRQNNLIPLCLSECVWRTAIGILWFL